MMPVPIPLVPERRTLLMNGAISAGGSPARFHIRGGVTTGRDTPGMQAMGTAFANEGLTLQAKPSFGGRLGVGYDVIAQPLSQRSRVLVGTEVDFGMAMLEGAAMVANPRTGEAAEGNNGYMFHQMAFKGRVGASLSVGVAHRCANGLNVTGALVPSINLLNPQQVSTGLRLEAGRKLGGMVQVDCQVLGPGRGDPTAQVGAYYKL